MADQTDPPPFWGAVADAVATLAGIGIAHPGQGINAALRGNYHTADGDQHGGIADWVDDHPPSDPAQRMIAEQT